ncbi:hypothetical protein K438DRAFT_477195 [Mycena galopus ATCC 62051]|nr:hypothetical protein K438DRAFT_477195 [Mycena galopus ATCC 62051]
MAKEKFERIEFGPPNVVSQVTVAQDRMFGALYESILYGINLVLFAGLLYTIFQAKKRTLSQLLRLGVVGLVFSLCTAHLAAVMRGLYLAFFVSDVTPDTFYLDHTQPVDLAQKVVFAAATFFADGLFIHRVFVVFEKKKARCDLSINIPGSDRWAMDRSHSRIRPADPNYRTGSCLICHERRNKCPDYWHDLCSHLACPPPKQEHRHVPFILDTIHRGCRGIGSPLSAGLAHNHHFLRSGQ